MHIKIRKKNIGLFILGGIVLGILLYFLGYQFGAWLAHAF